MSITLKIIGVWVFFDGVLSLFLVRDRRFLYQLLRGVRAVLGIILFFI
jgi:hypothetical protein